MKTSILNSYIETALWSSHCDYGTETGKKLTELSKTFGEVNLYLNDEQQIEMD